MERKIKIGSGIITAAALALLLPLAAFAADPFAGNIRSIDSADPAAVAKIVRLGYAGIIPGKPGDAVYTGDTIKTAEGVRVQIALSDNSIVTVAPNSALQMKGYSVDTAAGKRSSVMKTLKGTVRFVIAKFFKSNGNGEVKWKESNVTIEATNAVAGVRGSDVIATSLTSESEFAVIEGALSVRHSSPTKNGSVLLGAGQVSTVTKDLPPSPAAPLSPERAAALENATKMVNPRTTAAAPGGQQAPKKAVPTDKDVAKDLAAGVPLATVIDNAVDAGMPLAAVIGAALDAGVPASTLVYTSVTEGYSAKEVVTAAIEHGAPLTAVVAAAIGAGADKTVVISGATDAGVPPAAIATAVATATSPNATVYGTTAPMESTPAAIIPTSPPAVGGGAGGTPSTQPASPY